jgi:Lrp/AsnC family transcriptional regulator
MYKLDQIDIDILRILQQDANVGVKHLAKALNLTKTPIYERIKKLEQDGIIQKYVALVNSKKIGNNITVFCSVSLDVQKLPEIQQFNSAIMELPEVLECYLMGGSNDFLLKVMVEDLDAYHQFSSGKLAALENVNQIKSSFVLNEVKKSTVIPTL